MLLQFGASVGGNTLFVKTSFVTDCYRAVVVANGMNATNTLGEYRDDVAIATYIIVIRGLTETLSAGVYQAIYGKRLVAAVAGTVNHEEPYVLVV